MILTLASYIYLRQLFSMYGSLQRIRDSTMTCHINQHSTYSHTCNGASQVQCNMRSALSVGQYLSVSSRCTNITVWRQVHQTGQVTGMSTTSSPRRGAIHLTAKHTHRQATMVHCGDRHLYRPTCKNAPWWQYPLSVCLSVTRVDQWKTVEVRIMEFSNYSSPIPLVL